MQNGLAEVYDSFSEVGVEIAQNLGYKIMVSFMVTIFSSMYVPIAHLVPLLIFLMMFDFVLGVWKAGVERKISSTGFRKGFYKIILYFCGISVICLFAATMKETFGTSLHIDIFAVGFLSANECLSCLAHLSKLGFPVPVWLVSMLQEFHDDPYQFMKENLPRSHDHSYREEERQMNEHE